MDTISLMSGALYIQIAIPIGYVCYFFVRIGLGEKDKTIYIIYISLIFSFISVLSFYSVPLLYGYLISKIIASMAIPISVSVLWRTCLSQKIYSLLRCFHITNATEYRTVFSGIINDTSIYFTQIAVYLKNGKILICDYTYDFHEDVPIEGYRIDNSGNIALYVTSIKDSEDGEIQEVSSTPIKEHRGGAKQYRITYVKESEISRVQFVYTPS